MIMKIGRRHSVEVSTLSEASKVYQNLRDASGEGSSSFPNGSITGGYKISYNGRVWKKTVLVEEAAR